MVSIMPDTMKQSYEATGEFDILNKVVTKDGRLYLSDYKGCKCTVIVWDKMEYYPEKSRVKSGGRKISGGKGKKP